MAIKKYTKDQMRDHFERWLAIQDELPIGYMAKVLKKLPHVNPAKITNVAYNRAFDFEILQALEELVKKENASFLKRHKMVAR